VARVPARVDTGMHWKGGHATAHWNISAATLRCRCTRCHETDRYNRVAGQALAYKMASSRSELREKAHDALGERFDLRAFHDAVLETAACRTDPRTQIDEYIAAAQKK